MKSDAGQDMVAQSLLEAGVDRKLANEIETAVRQRMAAPPVLESEKRGRLRGPIPAVWRGKRARRSTAVSR